MRKAFAKHTPKLDSLSLDSESVVVIDEAGMIGTKELERLVGLTTKAGAKLVLVGDHRQLQAIDGGAPFRFLAERLGAAKLTEIIRQYEPWMVNAVKQFAEGDARGALTQYALAQKLSVADTRADAIQKLIQDWNQKRTAELKESLILAGTRAETKDLNLLAQDARRQQGELGTRSIRVGENLYFEGDRIVFTKNSRPLGVSNGDFGTIENIRGLLSSPLTPLTIRLDHEDEHGKPVRVTLTPAAYKDLELGYAVTTHKAQGATVDRTFVLGGGWMQDRELSYVQMSRHREDCHIYTSVADAGEDLGALSQSMSHSRMKGSRRRRRWWYSALSLSSETHQDLEPEGHDGERRAPHGEAETRGSRAFSAAVQVPQLPSIHSDKPSRPRCRARRRTVSLGPRRPENHQAL